MRLAYGMVGIGILVILAGMYFINHPFTPKSHTSNAGITNNPNATSTITMPRVFTLSSPDFLDNGPIPSRFTCDGAGVNPHLSIEDVPEGAKSLVLLVNDPDVPRALKSDGNYDHWVLFNIPPRTTEIATSMKVGTPGANNAGKSEYAAPCPPKEYEPSQHRYFFKLYALDDELSLTAGASRVEVENAMGGHVIAEAQLVGTYKRQ
jgi:Raf kinase inhibitor-like YbhB/YbcL family protein